MNFPVTVPHEPAIVICRNGVSIELTNVEIHKIHRACELNSLFEDAEAQYMEWADVDSMEDDPLLRESFLSTYGFTPEDAVDQDSPHCLLPTLVHRYEQHRDCNVAENDIWRSVISECMADLVHRQATD